MSWEEMIADKELELRVAIFNSVEPFRKPNPKKLERIERLTLEIQRLKAIAAGEQEISQERTPDWRPFSRKEIAALFGVAEAKTIYNWARSDEYPWIKCEARKYYLDVDHPRVAPRIGKSGTGSGKER